MEATVPPNVGPIAWPTMREAPNPDIANPDIANPDIKPLEKRIGRLRKALDKLYKQLTKTPQQTNKDGTVRGNSRHLRLQETIERKEQELTDLRAEKGRLPERVDVSTLQNYRSFKQVNTEGKYLFDFVTAGVWNARKQMVEWLRAYYDHDNEVVDLFYAISHCLHHCQLQ